IGFIFHGGQDELAGVRHVSIDCGWELETGRKIPPGFHAGTASVHQSDFANRLIPASSQPPTISTPANHNAGSLHYDVLCMGYRDPTRFCLSPCFGPPHPPLSAALLHLSSPLSCIIRKSSERSLARFIIRFSLGFFFLIPTCSVGPQSVLPIDQYS
ncbi:hypothetical protein GB937_001542, partial [Aspergillus fischeri]